MKLVGAKSKHVYEDRASRRAYVIPQGESRQLPDEIAAKLVAAHPDKLYYAKEHEKVRGPKRRRGNRRRDVAAKADRRATI